MKTKVAKRDAAQHEERFRKARKHAGLSISQAAKLLNISKERLQEIESHYVLDLPYETFSEVYGVSRSYLYIGSITNLLDFRAANIDQGPETVEQGMVEYMRQRRESTHDVFVYQITYMDFDEAPVLFVTPENMSAVIENLTGSSPEEQISYIEDFDNVGIWIDIVPKMMSRGEYDALPTWEL